MGWLVNLNFGFNQIGRAVALTSLRFDKDQPAYVSRLANTMFKASRTAAARARLMPGLR